jgi:hypothetical protein
MASPVANAAQHWNYPVNEVLSLIYYRIFKANATIPRDEGGPPPDLFGDA